MSKTVKDKTSGQLHKKKNQNKKKNYRKIEKKKKKKKKKKSIFWKCKLFKKMKL